MPTSEPLKKYLEALESYNQGNREAAAQKLAEAFGAKEPSPVMTNSLDKFFNETLIKACAVIVDSEMGKNNVIKRFSVDESRVVIQPFSPAPSVRNIDDKHESQSHCILEKYEINNDYIFYPAQFWPHKNHVYILEGLKLLYDKYGILLDAVFSGSDKGNLNHVREYASRIGLESRVKFIGFVENSEMSVLYRKSIALVMPTYFGPTNLPPLEAFSLEVPVLYSDLPGLREQVGDAAILMDLTQPLSLADSLKNLIESREVRENLIRAGSSRLVELSKASNSVSLSEVIKLFQHKRACWR